MSTVYPGVTLMLVTRNMTRKTKNSLTYESQELVIDDVFHDLGTRNDKNARH